MEFKNLVFYYLSICICRSTGCAFMWLHGVILPEIFHNSMNDIHNSEDNIVRVYKT